MQILDDEASVGAVADAYVRDLLMRRLADMTQGDPYEPELHGFFVLMAPGDPVADVEAAVGAPLLGNPVSTAQYGEPAFQPIFEYIGRHPGWYELVLIPGNGDFGVVLLVPDDPGIEPRLLALCAEYAVTDPTEV